MAKVLKNNIYLGILTTSLGQPMGGCTFQKESLVTTTSVLSRQIFWELHESLFLLVVYLGNIGKSL